MKLRQVELARAMGLSDARISQILNGRLPIKADVALRLGTVTSTDPAYWLRLQMNYDLYRQRLALGTELAKLPLLGDRVPEPAER